MNRSRFEIMADIMQACLVPQGKTRLMCKVKLNFTQANEYLSQLTSLGLLSKEDGNYVTTEKGRQFLSAYNYLCEVIGIREPSLKGMRVLGSLAPTNRQISPVLCRNCARTCLSSEKA